MNAWFIVIAIWFSSALVMALLWRVQKITRDAGIVDAGWAFSLSAASILIFITAPGDMVRKVWVLALSLFWSGRLGYHILFDRVLKRPHQEDGRYRYMREVFGEKGDRIFFIFFQAQAVFVVLFSLPVLAAAYNPNPFQIWDSLGFLLVVLCLKMEWLADYQLAQFRSNPENKGKTCRKGLWRYSRHPNYFFEWLQWFGYIGLSVGSPLFGLAVLGPVQVFVFLWKITGIPHTERQALKTREDYKKYQRETSMFFPWFHKKENQS